MKREQLSKYLTMDIADLVRQLRGPNATDGESELREAVSAEAALRIVARDEKTLDFYSTLGASRLFSIAAHLAGSLGIFAQERRVTLTVPIRDPAGTRHMVKVSYQSPADVRPSQELDVLRASCANVPPATQMLEVVFGAGNAEYRYVFEMDRSLAVADFQEVDDHRPLFSTTPPVAQMSAFLRAITQQRRDLTRILEDIAQTSGSSCTRETLGFLLRYYRSHSHEAGRMVAALERLMEDNGRKIAAPTLGALCLFVDMERGALTAPAIAHTAETGEALEISPLAALAVASHFGVAVDAAIWSRYFSFCHVDFEQLQREVGDAAIQQILTGLRNQQGGRTTLQVLQDLARESKSARVNAFVAHLATRLSDGQFEANDVQRVLLALLESNGRPVRPSTLTALCLFVDVEVGHVTEERIEEVAAASVDSSIYSMVAVAGAFDVGLRGFILEGLSRDPERYLSAFLKLAEDGVLVACRRIGGEGRWWRWLRTHEDLQKAEADQIEFTGEVLGSFPVLDQLDDTDLEACLASGATCLVRFRSAQDGTFMWHKMDEAFYVAHVRDYEVLVEGFTAYHYVRTVVGEVVETANAEERHPVAVYADSR
ncbi:MAG: hypothetical protein ACYCW6_13055, partial [Candidatus Xenobia bacterium]